MGGKAKMVSGGVERQPKELGLYILQRLWIVL